MQFIVVVVAVAPVRKEASHRSEIVTELLFGETAKVIETVKDFIKIQCTYDGYEGWIQTNQTTETDESFIQIKPLGYTYRRNSTALFAGTQTYLSVATPVFDRTNFGKYSVEYQEEDYITFEQLFFEDEVIKMVVLLYENVPYLWGGKSSFGIDCSGFTQLVFKMFNKYLQRDAYQQALQGEVIGFLQEAKCGDLAFFDNEEGRIVHVGIMLSNEDIIHASGRVRIDKIDNQGIINSDTGQRTHRLRVIKRV